MRSTACVVLYQDEEPLKVAPVKPDLDAEDVGRVQWYLTQRWTEFYRQHKRTPIFMECSTHTHACYEASLTQCMRYVSVGSTLPGQPPSLYFKASVVKINPSLKGWDLRMS